jgi:N-acetylneuraminic acid mutarotase
VWTGTVMIVWGGYGSSTTLLSGGRYNPVADSWNVTNSGANVPSARAGHTAVWSGTVMVVWGGGASGTPLNSGGRYNPTSNAWTAVSTGTNAPSARFSHSAVWSGTEMIIWGGCDSASPGCSASVNTGGRYNPSTNAWLATSTAAGVPEARINHTAVWTGSKMVVWGGSAALSGYTNAGALYDPSVDSWLPTDTLASPAGRQYHTAVWTGAEMIIWGGNNGIPLNDGGRYDPATNSWTPTSIIFPAPNSRFFHTAVWSGKEMIVWGGEFNYDFMSVLNDGGGYSTAASLPSSTGGSLRVSKPAAINLSWSASAGQLYYNINRCRPGAGSCGTVAVMAKSTNNSYSEANNGNSYFYSVEGVNACGVTP